MTLTQKLSVATASIATAGLMIHSTVVVPPPPPAPMSVSLSWDAPSANTLSNAAGYHLYLTTSNGTWSKLLITPLTNQARVDGLSSNQVYRFRVAPFYSNGVEGDLSAPLWFANPTTLFITASNGQTQISFYVGLTNTYALYSSTNLRDWTQMGTINGTSNATFVYYTDKTGPKKFYRLK